MPYVDVTDQTFQTDVIDKSTEVPVVVDLWAEWCGPCKTLGPIIEKAVGDTDGKVILAKVDVDKNPQISKAFQVQSIPAVYALKNGEVVEGFIGAQPEANVTAFIQSLLPSEEETQIADLLAAGDETSLRQALELAPDHAAAITALAALRVEEGSEEARSEALDLLAKIPETADTRQLAARARADVAAVPDDVGDKLDALLARVKDDDEAKQAFLDTLEIMGPDDPRTPEYRKKLTSALF